MNKRRSRNGSDEYTVGKNRPPVQTRFKPGQSGNPKGRPKGVKSRISVFNDVLKQKLTIQQRGRNKRVTFAEGIARNLIRKALEGNRKATTYIIAKEPEVARQAKALLDEVNARVRHPPASPEEVRRNYEQLLGGSRCQEEEGSFK
jgi:Family of unknown function (DUF5681)